MPLGCHTVFTICSAFFYPFFRNAGLLRCVHMRHETRSGYMQLQLRMQLGRDSLVMDNTQST